jgi:hypothetical protein
MLHETQHVKRGRGVTKFQGISLDAKRLGVNRIHLWLCLTGRRTSHRLLKRYKALKGNHQ